MFYVVFFCVLLFYFYGIRTFNYWRNRGIKNDKPLPYFGNNLKQFIQKSSMAMVATDLYKRYPEEKVVGFFRGTSPELVIRDPVIIKRILVTDFQHFYARGFNTHETVIEPLLQNLFFADGDLWRLIRQRFGQSFSTGKIKSMFSFITDGAEKLQSLANDISELDSYDIKELMARYTTDFIGACGFGINMDTLGNDSSEFRKLGKRIFQRTFRDSVAGASKYIFPDLCRYINFLAPELETSINTLVQKVMHYRNYKPCGRNDFIDIMLELKERGKISVESLNLKDSNGCPKIVEMEFTDLLITAQSFLFFGAGFETTSTTSSFTLHQLAYHPDWQLKVQNEIDRVLIKYNGKITYEAVNEMQCLEKCFYEAMRLYPAVGFLMRKCTTSSYTFPEIGLTIDKGVKVIIPIQAIHNDEKYFYEPNKFHPDRFTSSKDMKNSIFLPFGDGPRACIAARLGKLLAMAGIAAILHKFQVEPSAESKQFPEPDPMGTVSESFIGGLPIKLRRR
ncbi:cytochrome P450 6B6-like [Danaus plexippus]|uniref:cytochrome P450 6B6-like n=1 Tax=Danaus plexippus TaxID=13037 RepID=UPI002AAF4A46|nr:cytochrome P450 6B6-like [Danaus plexippus]